jgi:hypothetical protein
MVVLKRIPEATNKLPAASCIQARDVVRNPARSIKGSIVLNCWQKANFVGKKALLLKKSVMGSLRAAPFIKGLSSIIIKGLKQLAPTFAGLHLRLEADATAGGISRSCPTLSPLGYPPFPPLFNFSLSLFLASLSSFLTCFQNLFVSLFTSL